MPEVGVKRLTSIKFMVPGHRVVIAHFPFLVRFFIHFDQWFDQIGTQGFKIVKFVDMVKSRIEVLSRNVRPIHYRHRPLLDVVTGVTGKISAHQFVVPRPAILGI